MTIVVIRTEKKEIERPETKKKEKKKKVHPIKTRARSVWIFSRDNADITGNRITSVMSAFFSDTG